MKKKILILGVNGFIGSHLLDSILSQKDWIVRGLDLHANHLPNHDRFTFVQGDMIHHQAWIEESIAWADVMLPLAAIANPVLYVKEPLRVFELDFQANLPYIPLCLKHQTRLVFPSTSEVYGLCQDPVFDEATSPLTLGPIHESRWIYGCLKQLLDRIIHGYGTQGLDYTLFRPFNWIGPRLDNLSDPAHARVVTRFIADIIKHQKVHLVNRGTQKRCFLDVRDGIAGLLQIIENKEQCASQEIFNLGFPEQNISIATLAHILIERMTQNSFFKPFADQTSIEYVDAVDHYGLGYADVGHRVPAIDRAHKALDWSPTYLLPQTLDWILVYAHSR